MSVEIKLCASLIMSDNCKEDLIIPMFYTLTKICFGIVCHCIFRENNFTQSYKFVINCILSCIFHISSSAIFMDFILQINQRK